MGHDTLIGFSDLFGRPATLEREMHVRLANESTANPISK